MRVLIIEDEEPLRKQIAKRLEKCGFVVEQAGNGEDGEYLGLEYPIDLAILDLGLPDKDGLQVLSEWRQHEKSFPVLILTARGRWQEKVEGLETGADDYLVKPFQMEELEARINALLRRSAGKSTPILRFGDLQIDTIQQMVFMIEQEIELTAYEYRVIEYLALHAGEVVSKSELTEHLYSDDDERDSNVLEVLVGRLRKKIDKQNPHGVIETLRGRGYRLLTDISSQQPG